MAYTTKKAELPEGFVDLGEKMESYAGNAGTEIEIEVNSGKESKTEYYYPTLYFRDAEGLKNLPNSGTASISFKKVMEKTETVIREGEEKKTYCVELQINGIKAPKSSSSGVTVKPEDEIEKGLLDAEKEIEETEEDDED